MRGTRRANIEEVRSHNEIRNAYRGPFIIDSVSVISTHTANNKVYYTFQVNRSDGLTPWEMELRYSDLYKTKELMEIHDKPEEFSLKPKHLFPEKDRNHRSFHTKTLTNEEIEHRSKALKDWLQERIDFVKRGKTDKDWVTKNLLKQRLHRMEGEINALLCVYMYVSETTIALGSEPIKPTTGADNANVAAAVAGEGHRSSLSDSDLTSITIMTKWFEEHCDIRFKKANEWAVQVVRVLEYTSLDKLCRRVNTAKLLQEKLNISKEDAEDLYEALVKDNKISK